MKSGQNCLVLMIVVSAVAGVMSVMENSAHGTRALKTRVDHHSGISPNAGSGRRIVTSNRVVQTPYELGEYSAEYLGTNNAHMGNGYRNHVQMGPNRYQSGYSSPVYGNGNPLNRRPVGSMGFSTARLEHSVQGRRGSTLRRHDVATGNTKNLSRE